MREEPLILCELRRGDEVVRRWLPRSVAWIGQYVWLGGSRAWIIKEIDHEERIHAEGCTEPD